MWLCGCLERTDFEHFLLWEGVVVLGRTDMGDAQESIGEGVVVIQGEGVVVLKELF